jgi:hypothetical protein
MGHRVDIIQPGGVRAPPAIIPSNTNIRDLRAVAFRQMVLQEAAAMTEPGNWGA